MSRLLTPVASVCVLLVCVSHVAAQETKTAQGTVRTIGSDSLTVKVNDAEMTFKVDSRTEVIARGASTATRAARAEGKAGAALADLVKPGQAVEVRYHADMHAATVRVLPALPSASADRPQTASGVVTAVSASSLTIKGAAGELTFAIDASTKVIARGAGTASREKKADGHKPSLADFVGEGDTVSVRYREGSGTNVAAEVRVTRKRAAS